MGWPAHREVSRVGSVSCRELADHSLGNWVFPPIFLLKLSSRKLAGYDKPCVLTQMPVIKARHGCFVDKIKSFKYQHHGREDVGRR